jgi:hypothetical protein
MPARRGGIFRFAAVVLFVLFLLVALAPTIVSMTPLGSQLVASAAKGQIDGSLEVSSVRIGWLSPVRLSGITIKDKQDQTLATVDSIVVGKSLLALISNSKDLGTITIDKPQLLVVARENGSNLEDLLAPLLSQPSSGGAMPTVVVDVRGGLVKLVDGASEQSWEFTPLDAHVESPRDAQNAWNISLKTKVDDAGLVADVVQVLGDNAATHATVEADRFPLAPLQPLLARVLGPVRLAGGISGKIEAELADGGKQQSVLLSNVDAQQLAFACERLLGQDVLQLSQAKGNGSAKLVDGVWQLRDLEIQSEVAALVGSGDVRVSDFTSGKAIPQTDCDIRGVVDLARLMQLLPNTLRARQGVQLTSGQAHVSLTSQAVAGGRRFAAELATEDIQATNNGRPVALDEPVQFTAAVLQTPQGWQIEKVDARSSFLVADATGTPQQGQLNLRGDLNKLAAELDQFVDLGDARLAGQLSGALQWKPDAAGTLAATGTLGFQSFELMLPGVMPWREDNLAVELQAGGVSLTSFTLTSARLAVQSGKDELELALKPAANRSAPLPVDVRLTGNLATWTPRLQAFVPLAGWQIAGPVTITAKGTGSAAKVDIAEARFDIQNLQVEGHGLHVLEPQLAGELKGGYDLTSGAASISSALIQTESVAASAEKLVVQTGNEPKISGFVALRGDVGRMMAWVTDPHNAPISQFAGETEAEATFTFVGGVTQANLKGQVTKLAYLTRTPQPVAVNGRIPAREVSAAAAWETAWSEPLITFGGDAAYDLGKDSITLDKMQATAGTSAVVASGTVSQLASRCQLDLTGEVRYDLATWTPKVRPLLGPTFDMTGSGAKPFEVHGPLLASGSPGETSLLPLTLTGKAGLGWEGAQWMALQVGPAELAAELKDSTIFVQPTKIPLSQGMLQMSPALALKGTDWLVTHEQARVIDHIVITPEMCDMWIKYVCPPLAGATAAQGKFSVDVDSASVPINRPTELDTKGKFIVHNVSVGPGPLARTLIGAVDQVKAFTNGQIGLEGLAGLAGSFLPGGAPAAVPADAVPESTGKQWLELPEQEVPVEVIQGRVHHTGLTLKTKEFTLRSTGSVGIDDQSLNIICEVPLRDEWLKDPKFAGLKGQTLKIPVKGTISQPKVDISAAFGGLVGLGSAGIKGALSGQLDQGLQKGTGAVQGEIGKVQDQVQSEVEKAKKKAEEESRKFLKGIFGK